MSERDWSAMSIRHRLPNRRLSISFSFECNGLAYTCTYSRYDDGRLAEIFLSNKRASSQSDANAKDAAVERLGADDCRQLSEMRL